MRGHSIRIPCLHNEMHQETHLHRLINKIIITDIHEIHNKIYEQTNK